MTKRSIWLVLALASGMHAQQNSLTMAQAVDAALRTYPSIRVSQEQMNAASAGIRLAQTAYLPRVDGLAQVNRATRNNVFGLLLPQNIVPSISGPVLGTNNFGTAWESAAGVLVTWQPFDFGLRRANVAAATAEREQAQSTINRTRFDVSVATADAFLTVLAAQQTAQAARAAVSSWEILLRSIHALVASELRPGADEARVQAELALARTQVAQAEQAIDVARATVAQFAGVAPSEINLDPGKSLDQLPPNDPLPSLDPSVHPLTREQNATVAEEQAHLTSLERTDYPQFSLQGSASARGTGLETDGGRMGGANGLAPTYQNVSVALTVTFPFMDRFAIREQAAMQSAHIRAAQAEAQVIATNLQAKFNTATAMLTGARRVAAETPAVLSSAREALQQATARYQAGLSPIDDVAQAQRLLVQAQIDDALARLSVWRARLEIDTARGDIQPFVAEVSAK